MVQPRRYATLLLITASQRTAAQFARLLPADRFAPEYSVCTAREAPFVLGESAFDVVVIDSSVPESDGTALAPAAARTGAHVLLLADAGRFETAAAFAEGQGFMVLPSPVDPALLRQSLGLMAASSARVHELEERAESLQAKMDELRLVDRAKLILIQQFHMSEAEAHRFIEKKAMDRCVTRSVVARRIIRTYQN